MLILSHNLSLPENEIELTAIRAQGAGGQNVNKVATAIHLRFDINSSSLPEYCKQRLLSLNDQRITKEGIIVLKAQQHRNQEKNREDALRRLKTLIKKALVQQKARRPTKPTKASQQRRVDTKTKRGKVKALRSRIVD